MKTIFKKSISYRNFHSILKNLLTVKYLKIIKRKIYAKFELQFYKILIKKIEKSVI